ncbi:hypothetical protein CTI12_AA474470 [Artemisia annua]|uniref:C3H1-type domain-containing protein n=1 Tax=Artemisia annua TaxID=35608 RepID=A0A2U1LMP8_ARTAN|nr:hypothetical protein CTI12_AA474470 [Artemisia annua]
MMLRFIAIKTPTIHIHHKKKEKRREKKNNNKQRKENRRSTPYSSISEAILTAKMRGECPERPGQPECDIVKFGAVCRFHHPRERVIPMPDCDLSPIGLPLHPVANRLTLFDLTDHHCLLAYVFYSFLNLMR